MASDLLDSEDALAAWARSRIDEAVITGRVDDTMEQERETLIKDRFNHLAFCNDGMKFTLKLFGDDSIHFKILTGFATHTSRKMRDIKYDYQNPVLDADKDTMEVIVPCDANVLNLMVRFWMNLSFRICDNPFLEYAKSKTDDPVYAQKTLYLESVLRLAPIINWAEDGAMADTICAEVRRKLAMDDDFDAFGLVSALEQVYGPPDEKPVAWQPTALFRRLSPILLSSLLRNHDKIARGIYGSYLRSMKSDHPALAYDIDMGLIWWHQRQMAELRGAVIRSASTT